ncbi:MAG: Uncharacterized protein Greene07147_170 [Parcubacteria group bacterium Greene0714_7]|nr:MAG: Uncharacterized protein Greene07147_170 [Parcubacteria group bacterium Greene0714_7]
MIAATAFVLGLAVVGGNLAYADTLSASDKNNPMSSLVSAIATKFNLNSADVQAVVDEVMKTERAGHMAEMQANQATRLAKAVTDGKLTQAQANLITAKLAEMKASMEANRTANQNLTEAERKTKMQAEHESLKAWATANNIPMNFLAQFGGKGHGFDGGKGPHGNGGAPRQGN